jgi:hypothetical protein
MKVVLNRSLILLPLMAWTIAVAAAGEPDTAAGDLSAQAIVDRAIARAEAQHDLLVDAKFESQVFMSIQSLDDRDG